MNNPCTLYIRQAVSICKVYIISLDSVEINVYTIYMTKKSTVIALAAVILSASAFGFNGIALAENQASSSWKSSQGHIKNYLQHAPGVIGTISSINGNIIAMTGKNNTTYTIDASTAKIFKNRNTVITAADMKVGDVIMAQGTVSGTSVAATTIFDGKPIVGKKNQGNFPGVMGVVSSMNGTTFMVTAKDGVVYTIDAANAKIHKGSPAIAATLSDILNGDTIMVRGSVSGTTVTASTILDGKLEQGRNKGKK
jgi:hypothetical protein